MTYDFDKIVDRMGTGSTKWMKFNEDIDPLWIADMDFPCAIEITQAMQKRLDHPVYGYALGRKEMYAELADFLSREYDWPVKAQEIVFVPGVMTGMTMASLSLLDSESSAMVITPAYAPLMDLADICDCDLITVDMACDAGRYTLDFEAMEKAIKPSCKVLLFCNPHNPVGRVFTEEELVQVADFCERHGLYILSDEIHCGLPLDGREHVPLARLSDYTRLKTVTVMAGSKTYNIAGMKCSFMVIHDEELRQKVSKMTMGLVDSVNLMGLEASHAAFKYGEEWLSQLLPYLEGNREALKVYLEENLPQARMTWPEGSFLAWIDFSAYQLPCDPTKFFLEEAKVALSSGQDYGSGGDGFVRLNFGMPRQKMLESLQKMCKAIQSL